MKYRLVLALLLAACLPGFPSGSLARGSLELPATSAPMRVSAAFSFCRLHPSARTRALIRGWFIPGIAGNGYTDGAFFDSPQAVPITTVNQWDTDGHWATYGALFTHITTRASVGPRPLTLHGWLACSTYALTTDRDPFARRPLHPIYGTRHGQGGSVTTWATAGGLKLSLEVPRPAYPRGALAEVEMKVQNVSRHPLGYLTPPGISAPGVTAPQAEVLDGSGRMVFPPAMPDYPMWPGPPGTFVVLRPGHAITTLAYIVVGGARIRASIAFNAGRGPIPWRAPDTLRTHVVRVRLTAEPAPQLTLHVTPGSPEPEVDVSRPPGVTGQPLEISVANRPTASQPLQGTFVRDWTMTPRRIGPGCAPLRDWHLRVAWPDHPVAALDYSAPQPTPTAAPVITPTPVPTETSVPSPTLGPNFASLLRRAAQAEASVHALHATGQHTSVDSSAQMHLSVQADCRSTAGQGIRILARTLESGQQRQVGRIDRGYIIQGPVLGSLYGAVRAWYRSTARGQWHATDLRRQWSLDRGISDPVWSVDPAYLNQVCPDLIRRTYLTAPLRFARHMVLGTTTVRGHTVWHLQEHLYFTLDLFVDAHSFRLRRFVLGDGARSAIHWRVRFDYSSAKSSVHVPVSPSRRDEGARSS